MTKDELLEKLRDLQSHDDIVEAHVKADKALLEFIDDAEIAESYENIDKYYS